ncbi:MAG: DNA gyrase inhibitor YacG [Planctomycetaceae bacterium]|nr:DNA gyrase inhibitor YacG [Planctomycetota bacterium]NUN52509.1 DNA gyrase inhibitor YacG [Planctomycetaceae bacterium]
MGAEVPLAGCPTCRKPVPADGKHRPFCCDRCRLADLGRWFRGDYVVSRPLRPGEGKPDEEE